MPFLRIKRIKSPWQDATERRVKAGVKKILCNKTFAAQDTFIRNDMRLIFGETDCLHLAMPYAFMAVFAV